MQEPFLTQPELISITRARADQLQTWVNRGHLKIAQPNPGRGKSRLYSIGDAVKAAIMARLSFFGVPADKAARMAEYAERRLDERGRLPWDEFVSVSFIERDTRRPETFISAGFDPEHLALGIEHGDAAEITVSHFSEGHVDAARWGFGLRARTAEGDVNEDDRAKLAAKGIHAEPFLFFPLGEVVNAVIAQAEAVKEGAP